ncbi:unnamed protein product [Didymodactylos carnosus]|uniref:Uncharacterized protein n=1 Tax=Didymodactylos carnosus TaxID=1234261 RepID=A0A815JAZ7_9BILA|nr:unnamed protein product [Didymodactylos carnosus]CAF1374309.1 unnamed protein product [Didymodactylos carnosus]CAF3743187.1 unnamed protein product [Didymodactylos carnosus]CAF4263447.1 unnamed protein product [Didymodactylos carnosus]
MEIIETLEGKQHVSDRKFLFFGSDPHSNINKTIEEFILKFEQLTVDLSFIFDQLMEFQQFITTNENVQFVLFIDDRCGFDMISSLQDIVQVDSIHIFHESEYQPWSTFYSKIRGGYRIAADFVQILVDEIGYFYEQKSNEYEKLGHMNLANEKRDQIK